MIVSKLMRDHDLRNLGSVLFCVADSLRWDTFEAACRPTLNRYAPDQELRMSYATWTQPSHTCLLAGLLPHANFSGALAADIYTLDLQLWGRALAGRGEAGSGLYPQLCLAQFAREHGWNTSANVAMPVLNENTSFVRGFDHYSLSPHGSGIASQIEALIPLLSGKKDFVFINAGETHYPYMLPNETLPRISGFRGAANDLQRSPRSVHFGASTFSPELLREMHDSQRRGLERIDRDLSGLIACLAKPLLLIFASDHGELFGEDGLVGHGPFVHRLLFEVPLAVGVVY